MATHDYVIDNSTGANVRADINNVLQAILTNNSSSSAPSTTAAYMFWADTTSGTLKIRNSSDNAWVELLQLDGTLTLEDGSASTPGLAFRDDLNTGIYSSAADKFNIATGGVERMELGSQTVFNEDGADVDFRIEGDADENLFRVDASHDRIGIGQSSPEGKLHIEKASSGATFSADSADVLIVENSDSVAIDLRSPSANGGNILFSDASARGSGRICYEHNSNAMFFTTNGVSSERMRIDSSGRLLLNMSTSVTGGRFQVNNAFNTFFAASNDTQGAVLQLEKTRSTSPGSYTIVQDGDKLGELQFKGSNGSASVIGANIQAVVNGTPGSGNDLPTDLTFRLMPDGSGSTLERMRISSSGTVNIGSTGYGGGGNSPILYLRSTSGRQMKIHNTSSATCGIQLSNNTTGEGEDAGFQLAVLGTGDGYINNPHSKNIRFATANTERMRLDSSGNLGIGTSDPSGESINGTQNLVIMDTTSDGGMNIKTGTSGNAQIHFSDTSGNGRGRLIYAHSDDSMKFFTAGSERMRILADGRVGIGDTTPSCTLEMVGTSIANFGSMPETIISYGTSFAYNSGSAGAGISLGGYYNSTPEFTIFAGIHGVKENTNDGNFAGKLLLSTRANGGNSAARVKISANGSFIQHGEVFYATSTVTTSTGVPFGFYTGGSSVDSIGSVKCRIHGDGDIENVNGNYGSISDIKLKENIVDANSQWGDIKAIKIRNYNFKAETTYPTHTQIGLIAQELELVCPKLVTETPDVDSENKELGTVTKSVNLSVLYMKAVKCLQEAITKIEVLETKVAALEAA